MEFRTVFDLGREPAFDISAAWLATGFVVAGSVWALVLRARDRKQIPPRIRPRWTTPKVLILFGSVIALLGVGLMGWDHWRLIRDMRNGEARTVEGPVQSYGTERIRTANTKKQEYRTYERFYVGDSIWFGYYLDAAMAGFYNQHEPRIAFRDGMMVRATYLYADGTDDPPRIVKLEIAE